MWARLSRLPGAATPQNAAATQQVVKHGNQRSIWTFPGAVKHNRQAIFLSPFLDHDGPVQHLDSALQIQDHGLGKIARPGLPQIAVQANTIFLIYCI
jgi:hypothetical protein